MNDTAFTLINNIGGGGYDTIESISEADFDWTFANKVQAVIAATALRRFGQPEEIADIVHALASPAGRWITSQNIDASGEFKL